MSGETQGEKDETKKLLRLGHNMYAATEGLKPAKTWDPMETDPLTTAEIEMGLPSNKRK